MTPTSVNYEALVQMVIQWLAVVVVIYVIVLIIVRLSNYYRLSSCPNCRGELKRSQRTGGDRFINTVSLGILPLKRYRCYVCYWEGPALDIRTNKKRGRSSSKKVG